MSSNQALDALLSLGAGLEPAGPGSAWGEIGRKLKTPDQCALPALFQVEGDRENQSKLGQMQRRKQQITWIIYQSSGADQAIIPAAKSFDLIDLIEGLFSDKGISFQTLGKRVYAAYIEGAIRRYPGDLDGIEMITIPISLLLP